MFNFVGETQAIRIMKYDVPFEKEFICRTLELLKQYETCCGTVKYEDTLFLNLCVGLLIMPQQTYFYQFKVLEHTIVDKINWGINAYNIDTGEKDVFNIIKHIRNSISHKRFKLVSENSSEITHIIVKDKGRDKSTNKIIQTFEGKFPITDFKNFVINITEYALKNFAN